MSFLFFSFTRYLRYVLLRNCESLQLLSNTLKSKKLRRLPHNPPCQFPIHCQRSSSRIYLLMKSQIRGLLLWVVHDKKMLNDLSNVVGILLKAALLNAKVGYKNSTIQCDIQQCFVYVVLKRRIFLCRSVPCPPCVKLPLQTFI